MNCPPIFYVRDDAGVPFATVVTNGDGDFGVSLCSSKDRFVKKKGRMIATGRSWDEKTMNCIPTCRRFVRYFGSNVPVAAAIMQEIMRQKKLKLTSIQQSIIQTLTVDCESVR